MVRVPTDRPDLLRDLEAATDHLPPLDLAGFRGAILIGDQAHLGVSIDMLHSLVSARQATETGWLAQHRARMGPWNFEIARLPSDPERRLRALIRVEADRVDRLGEGDFDELASLLPQIKKKSPGGCRPAFCYLIAHEDHVRIDGARFFGELERRAERIRQRQELALKRKRESSYEVAIGHIARIEEQKNRRNPPSGPAPRPDETRTRGDRYQREHTRRHIIEPPPHRAPERPSTRPPVQERFTPRERTSREESPIGPPLERPGLDPRFKAERAHPEELQRIKNLLREAGYETREHLVVDGVPLSLAAARPEGYPRRVLVTFHERLGEDEARRILRTTKGAGAELALAVTAHKQKGVDRVTLATNLKVIAPEAVDSLRLD